jgi:hypothetical protein
MIAALVLLACHRPTPPVAAAPAAPAAPATAEAPAAPVAAPNPSDFTAAEQALAQVLLPRDPPPPCDAALAAAPVPDPTASLAHLAEGWPNPPWVGMRAASCVAARAAEPAAEAALARWVAAPDLEGLARTAVLLLDGMPADVALRLATAALAGPHAAALRADVARSVHPEVRALAAD